MSLKNPKEQLKNYITDVFFETGTYLADTSIAAIEAGFPKVITVELQEYLYVQAKEKCKELDIDIHLGDSVRVMREILPLQEGKITFLLDAHIDGGNYRPGITPNIRTCPLHEELEIIKTLSRNDHTILIDDVRIIGKIGWGMEANLGTIIDKLKEINPDYKISYIEGEILDDVLVAQL